MLGGSDGKALSPLHLAIQKIYIYLKCLAFIRILDRVVKPRARSHDVSSNPLDPGKDFIIFHVAIVHVGIPPKLRLDAWILRRRLPLEPGFLRRRVLRL